MIYWRTTDADLLRVIHAKLIIAIRARGLDELKYVVNLERDQPGLGATMLHDILGDELCGLVKHIS